jgi:hypothetical protein
MAHFIPTAFDRGASGLVAFPAIDVERPVTCSDALVETTVLRAKQGIVISLINWSGRPLKGLAVKLALPDVPTGEATLASGLPVHRDGDRYVLDLDIADALVLRGR